MNLRRIQGFTLVELIVVILLLAIISAYAASRFSGRGDVAAAVLQHQVVSVVRQVQVNRMQSNITASAALASNQNFTLDVETRCVGSEAACSQRSDSRSDWVSSELVRFSSAPSAPIRFDLLGNPVGNAASGASISIISSEETCQVTINAQGYVSLGGCS
tara:strand:- start:5713 stop:6192 length:480 start_codon:yes stop_codon:yes gene_type:complete